MLTSLISRLASRMLQLSSISATTLSSPPYNPLPDGSLHWQMKPRILSFPPALAKTKTSAFRSTLCALRSTVSPKLYPPNLLAFVIPPQHLYYPQCSINQGIS